MEKIKRERAEKKQAEDRERTEKEQEQRESDIAYGNPLLNPNKDTETKRRWDDDVVFRNQARGTEKKGKPEFVNDLLRSDFHKRFMVWTCRLLSFQPMLIETGQIRTVKYNILLANKDMNVHAAVLLYIFTLDTLKHKSVNGPIRCQKRKSIGCMHPRSTFGRLLILTDGYETCLFHFIVWCRMLALAGFDGVMACGILLLP